MPCRHSGYGMDLSRPVEVSEAEQQMYSVSAGDIEQGLDD
jgi:hypothetical protein